jgi:hypothetical protein
MTEAAIDIKNHKRRGEWAELRFMAEAAQRGLSVSKPWGESDRYDIGVEHNGRFLRVQIKSVMHRVGPSYRCGVRASDRSRPYKRCEIDFVAIYIIPESIWYVLPSDVALASANRNISLTPHLKGHRYEPYKEAWHLLRSPELR